LASVINRQDGLYANSQYLVDWRSNHNGTKVARHVQPFGNSRITLRLNQTAAVPQEWQNAHYRLGALSCYATKLGDLRLPAEALSV